MNQHLLQIFNTIEIIRIRMHRLHQLGTHRSDRGFAAPQTYRRGYAADPLSTRKVVGHRCQPPESHPSASAYRRLGPRRVIKGASIRHHSAKYRLFPVWVMVAFSGSNTPTGPQKLCADRCCIGYRAAAPVPFETAARQCHSFNRGIRAVRPLHARCHRLYALSVPAERSASENDGHTRL